MTKRKDSQVTKISGLLLLINKSVDNHHDSCFCLTDRWQSVYERHSPSFKFYPTGRMEAHVSKMGVPLLLQNGK